MASDQKKRHWFELGAMAFARERPGMFDQPTYACPICLTHFTIDALTDKRLSVEHVPPESVGGRELLLTCTGCNNSAGAKQDSHAKRKEDVLLAMAGKEERPHRVKASIGRLRVNGELRASGGEYSLQMSPKLNKPGTTEAILKAAQAGTNLTVEHGRFSELSARISWLRSGYLALFAMYDCSSPASPTRSAMVGLAAGKLAAAACICALEYCCPASMTTS